MADLKAITERRGPIARDVRGTVIISTFRHSPRTAPCLDGFAVGQPRYGNEMIRPSHVFAIEPEFRWARTFSPVYRLEGDLQYRGGEH